MKRKKYNVKHKRDRRKDEIMQTAGQLFTEKGFDRVSLSDIADTVKLGRTTIYEYFTNKDEILALYLERQMLEYHERVLAIMEKKTGLQERLMEFIKLQLEYGGFHKRFSELYRSLLRRSGAISAKTGTIIGDKHREIYAVLTRELNAAIRHGEIRALPADLLMQILINATSFPIGIGKNPSQTAEEVFSIFWTGISSNQMGKEAG